MSFTALQGASLITAHALGTKLMVSMSLRVYQFLEPDAKKREGIENSPYMIEFRKAQANEVEYAALLVGLLLFFSTRDDVDTKTAPTLAVAGQVGYVWLRTLFGYPAIPAISMALVRYGGLALLSSNLYLLAFK